MVVRALYEQRWNDGPPYVQLWYDIPAGRTLKNAQDKLADMQRLEGYIDNRPESGTPQDWEMDTLENEIHYITGAAARLVSGSAHFIEITVSSEERLIGQEAPA